ncbi:MAG: DUF3450 family protein [Planctomycetota bacterium]|nr:DUF3450 family protein [Planctomycetota bacterium]
MITVVLFTLCSRLIFSHMSLFADLLDDAIEQLERKLQEERERYEAESTSLRKEEENLRKEVAELETELARLREKGEVLSKEQRSLREEEQIVRRKIEGLKESLAAVTERIKTAASALSALLAVTIPPHSKEKIELSLERSREGEGSLKALLDSYEMFLDSATSVRLFEGELVCGDGRLKKVKFLTFGVLGRIYLSEDYTSCGIVLSSPDSIQGWEYVHNPPRLAKMIKRSFNESTQKEEFVYVPLDVTGRVSAQGEMEIESLWEHLKRGGIVMVPLGIVALLALVLVVIKFLSLSKKLVAAPSTEEVIQALQKEGKDGLILRWSKSQSVTERVFAAVLRLHPSTAEVLEEALADSLSVERARLERFIGALGACVTVAPLLGLLGTVTGMIRTFETITAYGAGDPRYLAGGIREALITTEAGLIIAIPLLLLHSLLTGKIERILSQVEHRATELLTALGTS